MTRDSELIARLRGRADWYDDAHPGSVKTPELLREAASRLEAIGEPVAWEYERSYTEGSWTEPMLSHAKPREQRPGDLRNLRPLYTSSVQTREDGIRAVRAVITAARALLDTSGRTRNVSAERGELEQALHELELCEDPAIEALLSQPKGDKT